MKKQIRRKNLFFIKAVEFCLLFIAIGMISSCYRPTEGCINPAASNFDVTVDDPCADCCSFPDFILQFSHTYQLLFSQSNITKDQAFVDDFGNIFLINDFRFFIRDVKLVGDNNTLQIIEELEVTQADLSETFKDDIDLIEYCQSRYVIGTFNQVDDYHTLSFQIGLDFSEIDFSDFEEDYVLSENREELYVDDRFATFTTQIVRDTMTKDTLDLLMFDEIYDIELEGIFSTELGEGFTQSVIIDYTNWFTGIDMISDSEELILEKLSDNVATSFSLK